MDPAPFGPPAGSAGRPQAAAGLLRQYGAGIDPACGGKQQYRGYGTQKAEEELAKLFPEARILRMDQDTTAAKDAHEKLLAKFARHEYDIMVGTQMVAKGLDFE